MPEIIPVNQAHIESLGQSPPLSFKGLAVMEGDVVLGVVGYYPDDARMVLAAYIGKQGREYMRAGKHLKVLLQAGRAAIMQAACAGAPIDCEAEANTLGAGTLLRHLGFERKVKEVYRWVPRSP